MGDRTITLTRNYFAPIDAVWDAWTKAENFQQWLVPEGRNVTQASADTRVGGVYRLVMESTQMGNAPAIAIGGKYTVIEKPTKLVFTWQWEGEQEETEVTIVLKPISSDQTQLTLIHTGFLDDESQRRHDHGWNDVLSKLPSVIKEVNPSEMV